MENQVTNQFKSKGGRNKISKDLTLSHRLKIGLNYAEYEKVDKAFKESGSKSMSEYLRLRLLESDHLYVHNPVEILKTLDKLGLEVNRIGNNINQLAKYANILQKQNKVEASIIEDLNILLRDYNKERKEISIAIRALLIRKEG